MIRPRSHLECLERDVQPYDNRDGVLRLDMNEYLPSANPCLYRELMKRLTPEIVSAYPMVNKAYNALSMYIQQPIDKIVLTTGSDGVILSTLQAFCSPGDTVGYLEPAYGMYGVYCDMLALKKQTCAISRDFTVDYQKILDSVTGEMKVLIIANPNGVLGVELDTDFLRDVIQKGNKCGTVVLIDEVHADFRDHGISVFSEDTDRYDNLVIARSFSKSYGLAGVRVGYSLSHPSARKYLIGVRDNVEISAVASEAIQVWCANRKYLLSSLQLICQSKEEQSACLRELGCRVYVGGGNFILMQPPPGQYEGLKKALDEANIAVKYLSGEYAGWIRVTVGTPEYMRRFSAIVTCYFSGI